MSRSEVNTRSAKSNLIAWAISGAAFISLGAGATLAQYSSDDLLSEMGGEGVADVGSGETGAEESAADPTKSGVNVSEYMTVDIFVQDEQLGNVLQMLSLQSQRNIVASQSVSASVTANLYNVTFYEALDAILHVNGYGYVEQGNFIYVYTQEELSEILAEEQNLVSRVVQLNYLNANDAAEFVAPMLSDKGVIKTNGDTGEFSISDDSPTGADEFALAATLVIYDYAEHVDEIVSLLNQLDTRPSQVLVEATILQTQLSEANAFGVDFSFLDGAAFSDFFDLGGPLSTVNNLIDGSFSPDDNRTSSVVSGPGDTSGPGTLKVAVLHDDISIFLRALDEVTDTEILSNPKILALNRQPARVLVGRKIGYLSTTSTETSTTQSVEFLDTGTQLSFRPFISKDNMVRLELKPRVSEGVVRTATDATGAAVTIPDEITQEITTNVIIPDGSTVVLGGLFKEQTVLGRSQVPILGDLPILGVPFRGHDDSTDRVEIIFMVKPTIMNDTVLISQGEKAMSIAEDVRTGTRKGLLPWSRDKQTAQLNVKAERWAAEGNIDKALWALRRSLELNPVQPAAIKLRERLMNKTEDWPSRSLLERIMSAKVDGAAPSEALTESFEYAPYMVEETTDVEGEPEWQVVEKAPAASTQNANSAFIEEHADPDPDYVVVNGKIVPITPQQPKSAMPEWLADMLFGPNAVSASEDEIVDVPVDLDK